MKQDPPSLKVGYDPLRLAESVRQVVVRVENRVELRKYYRFRGGRWYGGIATADCVGCNLKCKFCWSWKIRDNPGSHGLFYDPETVASRIMKIMAKRRYRQARISGGEPSLSMNHLVRVLEAIERNAPRALFILETNGILLGARREYARMLSRFKNLHVRVSLKGCSEEEFHMLTGARPVAFNLQLNALENLLNEGVSVNPAVMLSFSSKENVEKLKERLREIDKVLLEEFEEEYVFLYPHVKELLRKHGLEPKIAFHPDNIPEELV